MASLWVGILVEKRAAISAWQNWSWAVRAVIPVKTDIAREEWQVLIREEEYALFHTGHLPVELHRAETAAYKQNLGMENPVVYVAVRPHPVATGEGAIMPYLVTVSPDEAMACTEGDDAVFPVAMPGFIRVWLDRFIELNHREAHFEKRKRKGGGAGEHGTAPTYAGPSVARAGWEIPDRHG